MEAILDDCYLRWVSHNISKLSVQKVRKYREKKPKWKRGKKRRKRLKHKYRHGLRMSRVLQIHEKRQEQKTVLSIDYYKHMIAIVEALE